MAHCVVGAARTFATTDQVALSLLRNLVEDYGGRGLASDSPDVFFHMKLKDDAPKSQKEWAFKRLHGSMAPVCHRACRFAPQAAVLLNVSHSGPAAPAATSRCFNSGFFAKPDNRARAVSQWHGFAACHEMLAAREAAVGGGARYDMVVLARPDLVWYKGVGSYCEHDLTRTTLHRGKANWASKLEARRRAAAPTTPPPLAEARPSCCG